MPDLQNDMLGAWLGGCAPCVERRISQFIDEYCQIVSLAHDQPNKYRIGRIHVIYMALPSIDSFRWIILLRICLWAAITVISELRVLACVCADGRRCCVRQDRLVGWGK